MLQRASQLLVVGALLGCGRKEEAAAPQSTPTEVVSQFFAAVRARDCATARVLSTGVMAQRFKEKGCDEIFRFYTDHKLDLVRVESVEQDGRDRSVYLVHVVLNRESDGKPGTHTTIARVSSAGGRMRLAEL